MLQDSIILAENAIDGDSNIQINKFGWTPDSDTGVRNVIWDGGAVPKTYTYLTSASALYISSSDAGDDQDYKIQGLDANWQIQEATVTANGKTFIAITGTWIRIFRVSNEGTTDNAGDIYVSSDNTDAGGNGIPDTVSTIKAKITIGNNQTLMALYTVPAGYTGFLYKWYMSVGRAEDMESTLWIREFGKVFQLKDHQHLYERYLPREFNPAIPVIEKSDIHIKTMQITTSNKEASAGFDMYLKINI